MSSKPRETELYAPIKRYLENQDYEVKGEVGKVDGVACRSGEAPVLIELKTAFSLTLFHQAIDRLTLSDSVYIAVPHKSGRAFTKALKRNKTLCRRLGIGLITVRLKDGFVSVHLDPGPYQPRKSSTKKDRLLREFERRVGDPNTGGITRRPVITAYRQDALRCLHFLHANGPKKAAHVASETEVDKARRIMSDNHYGWFDRVKVGVYDVSPKGKAAIEDYCDELSNLAA